MSVALFIFIGLFVVTTAALLLAAWIRPAWLRWPVAFVVAASAVFFDSYTQITNSYLTYSAFISMVDAAGFLQQALDQYRDQIMLATGKAILLFVGIGLRPTAAPRLPRFVPIAAPLLALGLLIGIMFVRAGDGARGLPVMYPPLAYASLFAFESLHNTVGPRQPVTLAHPYAPKARDIVLIIDESVSGNYLDLNTPTGIDSELAVPHTGAHIVNYGYAASIANCSAETNVTLRYGGTRDNYQRVISTAPSIWQYAKKAGLDTVYIDAQRTGGDLQNLMTDAEKHDIDQLVQFDGVPVVQRDMAALAKLVQLLGDDKPQLILMNKVGAHFPVADKYPDDFLEYRPVLPRGSSTETTDTGSREGFDGSPEAWTAYRNSYRNTLSWSVGEFFRRLFAEANLSHTALIYTSDHGQDLHERGRPGVNTHCDSDPVQEEGLVPLVLIQGDDTAEIDWQAHLAQNRNASSHYNIFPTLLILMGYDPAGVRSAYGPSLDVPTDDPFSFNVRFNARLGAKPDFRHIDVGQIVTPDNAGH
ncbi:sulfatase-like hydrolase/transferase [Mycolicibacterium sp. CBM1]